MFLCYCLPEKDSKSRTKTNSSPALIRAYGRTDGRTDVTSKFSRLDGLPISIAMVLRPRAPSAPAGAPLKTQAFFFFQRAARHQLPSTGYFHIWSLISKQGDSLMTLVDKPDIIFFRPEIHCSGSYDEDSCKLL